MRPMRPSMGAAMVPVAQLDLSDGPSADEADHLNSYRELLFNDNEQELMDGAVVDRRHTGILRLKL